MMHLYLSRRDYRKALTALHGWWTAQLDIQAPLSDRYDARAFGSAPLAYVPVASVRGMLA